MRKRFSKNHFLGKIPKLFLENLFMLQKKTGFKEDILIISLFEKNHFSLLVFYKIYKQNNAFFLMKYKQWNDFINFSEKHRKYPYPRDSYSTNNSLIQKHDEIGAFMEFLENSGEPVSFHGNYPTYHCQLFEQRIYSSHVLSLSFVDEFVVEFMVAS